MQQSEKIMQQNYNLNELKTHIYAFYQNTCLLIFFGSHNVIPAIVLVPRILHYIIMLKELLKML